jgi:uncharacterized damage-inducible protein DinB
MKTIDFMTDAGMSPAIGLLHSMVTYNYQRLHRLVDGMTQAELDSKGPDGEYNSVAQLLRHLAVTDLHWVYRLQSSDIPAEWQAAYGPMYDAAGKLPAVSNLPLAILLEQYEQVQFMFKQVCLKLTDEDLTKIVPFENGHTATVRWGIWHVADHSRHHYSQIVQLRKLFRK